MKTWREIIMEYPEKQRLEIAIHYLEELHGHSSSEAHHFMSLFGLTTREAALFAALNRASPRVVSRYSLYNSIYPDNPGVAESIVNVYICKIRAKLPEDVVIHNIWGVGYQLASRVKVPGIEMPDVDPSQVRPAPLGKLRNRKEPWSEDDDAELVRMRDNGSEWWSITEELGRTERACAERYAAIKKRNARSDKGAGIPERP